MILKTIDVRKFFGLSFIGALSMLLLSTSLETPTFASNASNEILQENQADNLLARDDDRDDRDDRDDDDDDDDRRRRQPRRRLQNQTLISTINETTKNNQTSALDRLNHSAMLNVN